MKILLVLFLAFYVPYVCKAECPGGVDWVQFNSSCYLFSKSSRNWLEAETDCKKYDGHASLASIDTVAKMSFVSDILKVLNYLGHTVHWIGASDYAIEGQWRWIKTGHAVQYFKWAVDEPNVVGDGPEDCASIQNYNGTYLWNDEDCFKHRYYYICETPIVSGSGGPVIGK